MGRQNTAQKRQKISPDFSGRFGSVLIEFYRLSGLQFPTSQTGRTITIARERQERNFGVFRFVFKIDISNGEVKRVDDLKIFIPTTENDF